MREGTNNRRNGIAVGSIEFSQWIDRGIRNNIETAIQELSRFHVTAALKASARAGHVRITGLNHPALPHFGAPSPIVALQGSLRKSAQSFSRRC